MFDLEHGYWEASPSVYVYPSAAIHVLGSFILIWSIQTCTGSHLSANFAYFWAGASLDEEVASSWVMESSLLPSPLLFRGSHLVGRLCGDDLLKFCRIHRCLVSFFRAVLVKDSVAPTVCVGVRLDVFSVSHFLSSCLGLPGKFFDVTCTEKKVDEWLINI